MSVRSTWLPQRGGAESANETDASNIEVGEKVVSPDASYCKKGPQIPVVSSKDAPKCEKAPWEKIQTFPEL